MPSLEKTLIAHVTCLNYLSSAILGTDFTSPICGEMPDHWDPEYTHDLATSLRSTVTPLCFPDKSSQHLLLRWEIEAACYAAYVSALQALGIA